MAVTDSGIVISVSPVPSNVLSPICTREEGKMIELSVEQSLNTASRMYFVPEFRVTSLNDVQPSKPPLMVTTLPGMLIDSNAVQFLKAPSFISATFLPNVTEVKLVQSWKVLISMASAFKLTFDRFVHPAKALSPIVVTLSRFIMETRPLQPAKALLPMVAIFSVNEIVNRLLQFLNALSPIAVT